MSGARLYCAGSSFGSAGARPRFERTVQLQASDSTVSSFHYQAWKAEMDGFTRDPAIVGLHCRCSDRWSVGDEIECGLTAGASTLPGVWFIHF